MSDIGLVMRALAGQAISVKDDPRDFVAIALADLQAQLDLLLRSLEGASSEREKVAYTVVTGIAGRLSAFGEVLTKHMDVVWAEPGEAHDG